MHVQEEGLARVWKKVRICFLLYLLLMVAGGAWLARARTTDWNETLWVTVYPINGDGSEASAAYISALDAKAFKTIPAFMETQARHFGVPLRSPIRIDIGPTVREAPPDPPADRHPLAVMLWSLKLRYWAYRVDKGESPVPADIEIFVQYFDPAAHRALRHSVGLQKGLVGVVNSFAGRAYQGSNQVVIAHELLHTLGATDKYDPATNQPLHPHGFADPGADPLYPQSRAEVMGGRIPISATEAKTPRRLALVVVGRRTAREIGWVE